MKVVIVQVAEDVDISPFIKDTAVTLSDGTNTVDGVVFASMDARDIVQAPQAYDATITPI